MADDPIPVTTTDQILVLLVAEQRETNRLLRRFLPSGVKDPDILQNTGRKGGGKK